MNPPVASSEKLALALRLPEELLESNVAVPVWSSLAFPPAENVPPSEEVVPSEKLPDSLKLPLALPVSE